MKQATNPKTKQTKLNNPSAILRRVIFVYKKGMNCDN